MWRVMVQHVGGDPMRMDSSKLDTIEEAVRYMRQNVYTAVCTNGGRMQDVHETKIERYTKANELESTYWIEAN